MIIPITGRDNPALTAASVAMALVLVMLQFHSASPKMGILASACTATEPQQGGQWVPPVSPGPSGIHNVSSMSL